MIDMSHYVNSQCNSTDRSAFVENTKSGRHVQRPLQAFQIFCDLHRQQLKQRLPHLNNAQLSKQLGELWSKMTPDHKDLYYEEARKGKMETFAYPYDPCHSSGSKVNSQTVRKKGRPDEDSPTQVKFGGYVPPFHIFSSRMRKMKKAQQKRNRQLPPAQTLIYNNKPAAVDVCHQHHAQQQQSCTSAYIQDYPSWPRYGSRDACYSSECEEAVANIMNSAGDYPTQTSPFIGQHPYPRSNNYSNMFYPQTVQQGTSHYQPMCPVQPNVNQGSLYSCQHPIQREPYFSNQSPVYFSPTKSPVSCERLPPYLSCGPFSDRHRESVSPSSEMSDCYQYQCLSPDSMFHTQGKTGVPQKSPYQQSQVRVNPYHNAEYTSSNDKQFQVRGNHEYRTTEYLNSNEKQPQVRINQYHNTENLSSNHKHHPDPVQHDKSVDTDDTGYVLIPCKTKTTERLGWPLHIFPKVSSSMLNRLKYDLIRSDYNPPSFTVEEYSIMDIGILTPQHLMQSPQTSESHSSQPLSNSINHVTTNSTDHVTSIQSSLTSDSRNLPKSNTAQTLRAALDILNQQFHAAPERPKTDQRGFNPIQQGFSPAEMHSERPAEEQSELTIQDNNQTIKSPSVTSTSAGNQVSNVTNLIESPVLKEDPF